MISILYPVQVLPAMAVNDPVIELNSVTKQFGDVAAVQGLTLSVNRGEVYGFLGPNGAGKTTTIHMLLSLVTPSGGTIRLFGTPLEKSSKSLHTRIGVLAAHADLYDNLTVRQHLEFASRIKETDDDPQQLCERVGLVDAVDRRASGLSTGMGQRLKLAIALVGDPDLLLLDEPTSGLDPNGAREVRRLLREENERGATVFFSSHILRQVEQTCDRVGIISRGKMVAEDTIDGLRSQLGENTRMTVSLTGPIDRVANRVRNLETVLQATVDNQTLELVLSDSDASTDVINEINGVDCTISSFDSTEPSLEDLFAMYTEDGGERR